jgi:hypothetical protein
MKGAQIDHDFAFSNIFYAPVFSGLFKWQSCQCGAVRQGSISAKKWFYICHGTRIK